MADLILNKDNEKPAPFVMIERETNGRVIGVIMAERNTDCYGKLAKAIMDEYPDITEVKFTNVKKDDEDYICYVTMDVVFIEEGEEYIREIELTKTAIY